MGKKNSRLSATLPGLGLVENSESGENPERYRHCMRGGRPHDESRPLGELSLRRLWVCL